MNNCESELERFARVWDADCQRVNAGKFETIKTLFLATVIPSDRDNVDDAIEEKYNGREKK